MLLQKSKPMTNITTTLRKIRKHSPCGLKRGSGEGYDLLRTNLGKSYGQDTPVKFSQIIESNGLDDALWCLRSICPEHDKEVSLFAADCAERVLHIYEAENPRKTIQAARDFANGLISQKELQAACAAWDAAWAATWAAERKAQEKLLIERFG